ncbi:MAG: sterol desaturase family protein [Saprospiraceae bacterium]|uniref:Sterol desaturase family protein n=1 Tax=Candidatus Opimibacter skivensis TaxID=2982028 RepID=A0A9D7SPU2_9BACT|nr:sterol desaturase family protein [Candidatus Opimibacter skivensis]
MDKFQQWLINSSEDFQFILFFGLLFLLIALEYIIAFRKVKRGKRWLTNFVMTLISIFAMMAMPVSFITAARYASDKKFGLLNSIPLNWFALLLFSLLLRGFISFFTHYLAHKIPLIWRVHRVHHLDTEMDVSTNVRFHPFEFIFNTLIGIPIILILGLPVWTLMLYELLDVTVTLISHSNISLPKRIENVLRYILVTPDLHRIHHSSYQPETDTNFGAVFPIWDIVFRTFKTNTKTEPKEMQLGLEEVRDEKVNNILWLLLSPFKNFKKNDENN